MASGTRHCCIPTDWDSYYEKPFPAARFLRSITSRELLRLIRKYGKTPLKTITELGGGGSAFIRPLMNEFPVKHYHVIDRNRKGLSLLPDHPCITSSEQNILTMLTVPEESEQADLVFSAGLIEHFAGVDLETVVRRHLELVRPGGLVVLLFPTPTLLYRITRGLAELLHLWRFPDEVPLASDTVEALLARSGGRVLYRKIIYPILLTQAAVVAVKER